MTAGMAPGLSGFSHQDACPNRAGFLVGLLQAHRACLTNLATSGAAHA